MAVRKSDESIFAIIRARSDRRNDIQSVSEAFSAGIIDEAGRVHGLEIVDAVWQKALDTFQASE